MPVKIDPLIVEELAEIDLTIWEAKHPKVPFLNEKTGKMSQRENKGWCIVYLAGPGVDNTPGSGTTLRAAVDNALMHSTLCERVTGLRGAMLRLSAALGTCSRRIAEDMYDIDDDIPF